MEYVGKQVKKKLKGEGEFLGTVKSFDEVRYLFEIVYEDGDSEEVNLSQIDSLSIQGNNCENGVVEKGQNLEEYTETEISRKVFPSRNVGRPRKKRKVNVGNKPLISDLDLNEEVFVVDDRGCNDNNGNMILDLNRNDEGGVELNLDSIRNDEGGVELNLDSSRNDKGGGELNLVSSRNDQGGVELNLDSSRKDEGGGELNLDSSRNDEGGVELNLNSSRNDENGVEFNLDLNHTNPNLKECLDLNKGLELEGCLDGVGIIDLNVDVNDVGVEGGDKVLKREGCSAGFKRKDRNFDLNLGLEDGMRTLDTDSLVLVKDTEESAGAEVNCENQELSSAVCSLNVEQETPVKKSCSDNVELRGTSGDGTIGAENMENESRGKRGRKRKKKISADNTPTATETVLRRSSRRARVAPLLEQVPILSTLEAGDDSSAISGVSEEKVTVPSPEENVEDLTLPPKVELPPSSGTFNLEGMAGLDVFSVYSFLRTFSKLLFLSPFELEDFVAAIRCNVPNLLFDSIHVSLLHALRKHMVSLADDSIQCACDCLRFLNWDLLDMITWPVFLVEYLMMHKHSVPAGFDLHHLKLSGTDYYSQPVFIKIKVLQCLCDEVTGTESVRSELNRRTQGTELTSDSDRSTKLNRSKRRAAADGVGRPCLAEEETDEKEDGNSDECCLCKMDGSLICCDGCPAAFHSRCVGVTCNMLPEGDWYCPECRVEKNNPWSKVGRSIRGADLLGADPFGRLFYSSCGYLLVSEYSDDKSSVKYYHRNDLFSVIEALKSSTVHYHHILNLICKNWHLSSSVDVLQKVAKPGNIEASTMNNCVNMETQIGSSVNIDCTKKLSKIHQNPETPEEFPETGEHPLTSTSSEIEQGKNVRSPAIGHSSLWTVDGSIMLQGDSLSSYVNHYNFSLTSSSIVEYLAQKEPNNKAENVTRSAEDIISGQLKAISSTFSEFSWPNIYNHYADSKKEKCGWCYYCQFPEYERGCFFIDKGKHISLKNYTSEALGVHPNMNRKSHLVDVMCHMLYMEDRLQGLLLGPWLNPDYPKLWRRSVLEASDIDSLKQLLLELESNIRHLAVSADWLKAVDSAHAVGSAYFVTKGSQRMPSKQGNVRKKARHMDSEGNSSSKAGPCLFWWRGGNISRELFNHLALPHYLVRKAARQAGCKKILDISYPENSEVGRRNRSIAWRAALEASSSVQQLALQVRELDSNIKWDEIQNTTVVSLLEMLSKKPNRSFKKVIIRRKCSKGIMSKYLLDFGKRRFIPDVVLKHGTLFEEPSSERKRYWLEETYVPLHLLKLFEEKRIARKPTKVGSGELQNDRTPKKPLRIKGFSYLFSRAERSENYQCGHCNKDVLIRDAVTCQYCKGFFHKRHVKSSGGSVRTKCTYTCHKCREGPRKKVDTWKGKTMTQKITKAVRVNRLPLKLRTKNGKGKQSSKLQAKRKYQVVLPLRRSPRNVKTVLPQKPKRKAKRKGKRNNTSKDSKKKSAKETLQRKRTEMYHGYWLNGLRLSRKPNDDRVMNFRASNVKAITEEPSSMVDQPKCSLCGELEITPMPNYIACEFCGEWFHGDAFNLTAERMSIVIGFKCHKCRGIDSPNCPYLYPKRTDKVISDEPSTALVEEGTARRSRRKRIPRILH